MTELPCCKEDRTWFWANFPRSEGVSSLDCPLKIDFSILVELHGVSPY